MKKWFLNKKRFSIFPQKSKSVDKEKYSLEKVWEKEPLIS